MKRLGYGLAVLVGLGVAAYLFVLPQFGRTVVAPVDVSIIGSAERGGYVATASGCYTCHTDTKNKGQPFAGGRPFKTPFGIVYSTNITPDRETGIGAWNLQVFKAALTAGVSPGGRHYFPVFPYTSYAHMRDQDIADLKAHLETIVAVRNRNREPGMSWPFSDRTFVGVWKWLYAPRLQRAVLADKAGQISRGAYLVDVLGHCGECHTQRNMLGGYTGTHLGGNTVGPDGGKVPGLRNLKGKWVSEDIASYLSDGMTPEGDFVGGEMSDVIDHSTGKLTDEDRRAIADYVLQIAD